MKLVLTITSFHKFTPEIESEFVFESSDEHAKVTFGRSEQCDWTLPDPERVISGTHGELIKFGDKYLIKDLSTNGTFVNNAVTPIGQGNELALSHGDTVALGDYQIQISISDISEDRTEHQFTSNPEVKTPVGFEQHVESIPEMEDFGLSAAELMDESVPSDFQLDIGLVDDFLEIPSHETEVPQPKVASMQPDTNAKSQKPTVHRGELEAFIYGMGIDPNMVPSQNREQWFEQLGQSFSLMLIGLMETLHNRAVFKQTNRVNHTAFRKSENNPLKFSANLEDAIHNLYNRQTSSFLKPNAAIKEAFNDIENHEQALMQGVAGTVSSVMSLVEPNTIYSDALVKDNVINKVIPARKYAQSWKRFEGIHSQLTDELVNKESPFYLEDFAKHYELALKNKG
ncbi:type VI secretion system-associated FHA domain protein TagH [Vibrio parahaemolyticus]|uniref:type VI secretion system-associated FHA domain protein TagH n=2 Tax=Vibrio parahaemolyticus TaxID=670 RepID=UPI00111D28AD|nr:type VI secretion system-associated FHA domain protein TagH [Vibrio parahaemolyticus]TOM94967.1 FHA domain-containing protein [Vibrio parahaemolyticus]